MKKITLYTLADKRPDFIPLQHKSLSRYVKDEYEYVVLNNAFDSKTRRKEIFDICASLGIRCIEVQRDKAFGHIGGERVFSLFGKYRNPNVACAYPIAWAWNTMIDENNDGLFSIIDSDMFLCRDISFSEEVGLHDGAAIIQYRGFDEGRKTPDVTYLWNAFCIFDARVANLRDMKWDCGTVNGQCVDVGGFTHDWLKTHAFNYRHISEYAIHKNRDLGDNRHYLEGTLNGNYHFSFEYSRDTKEVTDYKSYERGWKEGDPVLPHLAHDFEDILTSKTISYFETYLLDRQTYPNPTFIGFLEFEEGQKENRPFIIHSKAGSGYMGFGDEYGKMKLQFIEHTLGL